MLKRTGYLWIIAIGLISGGSARAQSELWLRVKDVHNVDVRDVQFSYRGSVSPPTSDRGETKLDLPPDIKPASIIYLTLHAPANMKIGLPLNARVVVTASANPEEVRVFRKGERLVLGKEQMVTSIAYSVLRASIPQTVELIANGSVIIKLRRSALEAVAKDLELPQAEVEQVIRNLANEQEPFMKAVGAVYDGKYTEAIQQLKGLATSPPYRGQFWNTSDANILVGQAYLEEGKFSEAAESFKQAVSAEPGNAQVFAAYGLSLFKSQQFTQSLEVWGKLLQMQPENNSLYLNQGLTFEKIGKTLDSIKSFQNFLKRDALGPLSGNVHNYLGDAYFAAGKTDEALMSYRSALKSFRIANDTASQETTFADIRRLYVAKPDLRIAAAYNEELLIDARQANDQRKEAVILSSMAGVYAQQGKNQQALELYANAVKIAEDSKALNDAELILVLKSYGALLQENKRRTDAERIEARVQTMLGREVPGPE